MLGMQSLGFLMITPEPIYSIHINWEAKQLGSDLVYLGLCLAWREKGAVQLTDAQVCALLGCFKLEAK